MSLADDEVELLDLPTEFEGLPYAEKRDAFAFAEAELPVQDLIDKLGQASAEQCLVQAAAHYLATTGNPNAQPADQPSPRKGHQVGEGGIAGLWAGSPYGDNVARILSRAQGTGKRRCSNAYTTPSP
jgi:hypothetical protein